MQHNLTEAVEGTIVKGFEPIVVRASILLIIQSTIPLKKQIEINLSDKRWLDPKEFAQVYGFSTSTQAKMRMASNHSTLPYIKVGRYIRYDRNMIDEWLTGHQI